MTFIEGVKDEHEIIMGSIFNEATENNGGYKKLLNTGIIWAD